MAEKIDIDTIEMPPESPPEAPPMLHSDEAAESITSHEMEESRGFLAGFWGVLVFIVLIGLIIGPFWWWLWTRSPLRVWLKIILTILPIAILAAVL